MRALFIALVLVGAASAAAAQSRGGLTNDMPTPSIGLPLPHIGLPLPPMGLPPDNARPFDRGRVERTNILERSERSEPFAHSERFDRSGRVHRPASIVLFGWPYLPQVSYPYAAPPWPTPQATNPIGYVYLNLHSGGDPRIFVDGYFVGLFSDYGGRLKLDAGLHTVELRDTGYVGLRLEVNLGVDEVITYDIDLKPIETAPPPSTVEPMTERPVSTPAPSTIYLIPGCYVGNVAPAQVKLPAGCDAHGLITFPSR
jgi:hypothetical protein